MKNVVILQGRQFTKKKSCAVVSIILRGTKTRPDFNRVIKKISRKGL